MPRSITQAQAAFILQYTVEKSMPHCKRVLLGPGVWEGTVPSRAGRNLVCLLYCSLNPALAKTVQTHKPWECGDFRVQDAKTTRNKMCQGEKGNLKPPWKLAGILRTALDFQRKENKGIK